MTKTTTNAPTKLDKVQAAGSKVAKKVSPAVNWVARGLAKAVFVILALDRVQLWLSGRVFDPTLAMIGAAAITAGLLYISIKK